MDEEVRNNEEKEEERVEGEKKSVSIKGVKKDVYNRMIQMARDSGRTLGELTNDAYRTFIGTIDGAKNVSQSFVEGTKASRITAIENIRNLTLTSRDLEEIGHRVDLRNIDDLDLSDVDDETFDKYIHQITGIKNLSISSELKKSKVLLKARFIDNIIQRK
ncbi:hypothetical protein IX51_08100 [uncultured archaeon]|nr:hypothetical protein IX51_08100 [uncultured archaeon]HKJ96884.1 hypothetical protein [Thermoplasmataceae archaeon]